MKNIIYQVLFLLFFPLLSFSQEQVKLLTSTKFNNGEQIPEAKTALEWEQLSMSNQPVFMKKVIVGKEYFFYNWYAISDKRQLVDEKWMIPNQSEMIIWNAYSPIETVPIGIVSEQGAFTKVTDQNYFWTSSEYTDKAKRESAVSVSISNTTKGETELKQAYKQEGFLVLVIESEKMKAIINSVALSVINNNKNLSSISIQPSTIEKQNVTSNNPIIITSNYKSVKIGNQTWMTENLNVDRFRNGDLISEAKTADDWKRAGKNEQPAWCYNNNDPVNGEKYGKLYNWYAVYDSRGLAPTGYHVPSDFEWTTLTTYLGGEDIAASKLKSNSGWNYNGNGTNSTGFSGLPGGYRVGNGTFGFIGKSGYWWSSSKADTFSAWYRSLHYLNGNVLRNGHSPKQGGFSVRCLRD